VTQDANEGPPDPQPTPIVPSLGNIVAMAQLHRDTYAAYVNVGFTPAQAMQLVIGLIMQNAGAE
jgi:hypothetical protein